MDGWVDDFSRGIPRNNNKDLKQILFPGSNFERNKETVMQTHYFVRQRKKETELERGRISSYMAVCCGRG